MVLMTYIKVQQLIVSSLAILIALLALAACNGSSQPIDPRNISATRTQPAVAVPTQLDAGVTQTATPKQAYGSSTVLASTTPDLGHMPLYPKSKNVKVVYRNSFPVNSVTTFDTTDAWDQVGPFYAEALAKLGWENLNKTDEPLGSTFIWQRDEITSTSKFALNMDYEVLQTGPIRVYLFTRRWADASKVPMLPDAKQVNILYRANAAIETQFPGSEPVWERVTTFKTQATPSEVEQFYRSRLVAPDWELTDASNSILPPNGISFRYGISGTSLGDPPPNDYGRLQITAELPADSVSSTEVQLVIVGTNISPPK